MIRNTSVVHIFLLAVFTFISCEEYESSNTDHSSLEDISVMDKVNAASEPPSLYEIGDTITDFPTNFENLFTNWNVQLIQNAKDYQLRSYSFKATISDSTIFRNYRNYFSGPNVVGSSISKRESSDSAGNRELEIRVTPSYKYRLPPDSVLSHGPAKNIFTQAFRSEVKAWLKEGFNIDTLNLVRQVAEKSETIATEESEPFQVVGEETTGFNLDFYTIDSLSKNYIDVFINRTKSPADLSPEEQQELFVEELTIRRINDQVSFNKAVHIGDRVYQIDMSYQEEDFHILVICDARTKKVKLDYFFKPIRL